MNTVGDRCERAKTAKTFSFTLLSHLIVFQNIIIVYKKRLTALELIEVREVFIRRHGRSIIKPPLFVCYGICARWESVIDNAIMLYGN